jgi:hypothetical protein
MKISTRYTSRNDSHKSNSKEINKLEGIYPIHKVIQGDKDNPIAITDTSDPEARDKRIAALIAKAMQDTINLFF